MYTIICLEKNNGYSLNCKRLTEDRAVIDDIANTFDCHVRVTSYSFPLFKDSHANIFVDNDLDEIINKAMAFFFEDGPLDKVVSKSDGLIIYRWNEAYTHDKTFDIDLNSEGFKLKKTYNFKGETHEIITKEIYCKE